MRLISLPSQDPPYVLYSDGAIQMPVLVRTESSYKIRDGECVFLNRRYAYVDEGAHTSISNIENLLWPAAQVSVAYDRLAQTYRALPRLHTIFDTYHDPQNAIRNQLIWAVNEAAGRQLPDEFNLREAARAGKSKFQVPYPGALYRAGKLLDHDEIAEGAEQRYQLAYKEYEAFQHRLDAVRGSVAGNTELYDKLYDMWHGPW